MKKLIQNLFLLSLIFVVASCEESSNQEIQSTEGMLQHNVYFYLNDSIAETEKKEFEDGIKKLLQINEIHKSEIGITGDTKSRDVTDHDFEYSLIIWFKSMKDYEVYAEHPVHMKFIESYKDLWAQVKVYDSKIISIDK